ncbi:MAG: PKD domain-containing protein [Actinomycetota bacterium]
MRLPMILAISVVVVASSLAVVPVLAPEGAEAAVHGEDTETRYREVWINHSQFRGIHGEVIEVVPPPPPPGDGGEPPGDGEEVPGEGEEPADPVFECGYTGQKWFAEPTNRCGDYRPMEFDLPSLDGVDRAEIFLDLWRAREPGNARFRINGNNYAAQAGADWSRTPTLVELDVAHLQQGENELVLRQASAYHLHDAAVRVYDVAGGSYPEGDGITSVSPAPVDGLLTVGTDETITLTANVSGADAVEFIAYYDGFDRDNDGQRVDWQSFTRNNWHPGRSGRDAPPPAGEYGTIGHIGTVLSDGTVIVGGSEVDNSRGGRSGDTYTIEFDTSFVPDGSPLRFKVRALNEAGDDGFWVVDALGGATDQVELARDDFLVDYVVIEDFNDDILHHASVGEERTRPDAKTRTITGVDLTDMVSVHLLHNFWERPDIHINPSGPSNDDCGSGPSERVDVDWVTSVMDVTDRIEAGANVICYEWVNAFGVFIESPGPMLVIRRDPDRDPTADAGGPYEAQVGVPITLVPTIADDEDPDLDVAWTGAGAEFSGSEATERAQVRFDSVGSFEVAIEVTDESGNTASDTATVTVSETPPPPTTLPPDPVDPVDPPPTPAEGSVGYWMGDTGGEIYGFGDGADPGSVAGVVVAMATTPSGAGPWVLTDDGVVHATNGASNLGNVDLSTLTLPGEVVASISVLPGGDGYWVFTDRGRAIPFGAAPDLEDLVDLGVAPDLNGPVVASAATPSGDGAYMVAADGGVFAVGSAVFHGSMGGVPLNGPVVGVATDPDGVGYWLVADDGGIFAFEAVFQGSMGGSVLNAPMVGAVAFGDGYLMVAADGGIFNFSDQQFLGSLGDDPPSNPVRAVAGFPV